MSTEERIRDKMAVARTFQANERTLLEYLRTGLNLLVVGVAITFFLHGGWFGVVGVTCILIGIIIGIVGAARFRKMDKHISLIQEEYGVDAKTKKG